jgi:hypothetical protein
MKRSWLLRRVTAAGIGLIALSAGSALAGCSCGFTAEQRARADKELWLNKKDQAASVSKHLPWGMPKNKAAGFAVSPLGAARLRDRVQHRADYSCLDCAPAGQEDD